MSVNAASAIAKHCPKLQKLRLDSCTHIDDRSAIKIGENCCRLRYLFISGHDRGHGALKVSVFFVLACFVLFGCFFVVVFFVVVEVVVLVGKWNTLEFLF